MVARAGDDPAWQPYESCFLTNEGALWIGSGSRCRSELTGFKGPCGHRTTRIKWYALPVLGHIILDVPKTSGYSPDHRRLVR